VTYRWKALDESYNFASNCTLIQGLLAQLWGSKVARVLVGAISGLPFGNPGRENHLDVGPVKRCIVYYKGEGGGKFATKCAMQGPMGSRKYVKV
jgi:hypothetical protein